MCLGQEKAELMGAQRPVYEEEDWVKMSLALPFVYEPGTKFVYNNVGPYLAGVLVERRAGCDLVSYLYPRLFKPLGIARPTWELDPYGHVFGAGGLFLTMDELHKLGLLYLQNGNWNGKQLVPESWVKAATSKQVENDADSFGYGYLFWGAEKTPSAPTENTASGPSSVARKNAVITVVAECRRSPELMDAVFTEVFPQV